MNSIDVIILCGGKGIRLRPLTQNTPKPLVKIKNKEIILYIIEYLEKFPLNNIYLATGFQSSKIKKFINKKKLNNKVKVINSGLDTDIIYRIKKCLNHINGDFLVLYGDTLSDVNINQLIYNSKKKNSLATMTVWNMPIDFGLVNYSKKYIATAFNEKPKSNMWINIGYFYFNSILKKKINKYRYWEKFLKKLVEKKYLNVFIHNSLHITVNTLHELKNSEEKIKKLK